MSRRKSAFIVPAVVVGAALVVSLSARGRVWAPPTHATGHPRIVLLVGLLLVGLLAVVGEWGYLRRTGVLSFDSLAPAIIAVVASLSVAVVLILVYLGSHNNGDGPTRDEKPDDFYGSVLVRRGGNLRGDEASVVEYLAAGAAVVLLVAVLGITVWRARSRDEPFIDDDDPVSVVAAVIDDSLNALYRERDTRKVVIACYARMEQALASVGVARIRSEVPYAYLARVLGSLNVPAEEAERLTRLFEEAKFSHHVVDETMRNDAIDCLLALRTALRPAAGRAPYRPEASLA